MRSTQTCPKCSGKKIAVVNRFRQPDQESSNGVHVLPAVTVEADDGWSRRIAVGSFETYICLGCGFVELYASGLEEIESMAATWPKQVRVLSTTPPDAFRAARRAT